MSNYILCGLLKAIADAIRNKYGTTETILAKDFPDKILNLSSRDIFTEIVTGTITTIKASDLDGITSIGQYAFTNCESLTSVTLPNTIISIDNTAFLNCVNLKTINVPWAEGAISGSPWGASNATINYNYGG